MVIGPVIEDGFYYDIFNAKPFTPDDMAAIEERMKSSSIRTTMSSKMTPRDEVIKVFTERGEDYKLRLIEDMPDETQMGLYYHQEYVDMCRGTRAKHQIPEIVQTHQDVRCVLAR